MNNPFTIYLIPPVFSLVIGLGLAFIAVVKGQSRKENRLFALVCVWWTLLAPVFIAHHLVGDESRLLTIERCIHFLYVYNPVINLLFFYRILGVQKPKRIIGGFILSFLLSLSTPTDYYFYGLHHFSWGYIAKGGIAFQIFGLYSIIVVAHCVYTSIKYLRREANPFLRLKKGYLCLSFSLIGILTLLNIPAINGINFYPMGNFTFLALGILGYGVLRHNLMDVRSVVYLTIFWLLASSLIMIPNLVIMHWLYLKLTDLAGVSFLIILMVWFALNMLYIRKVQPIINQHFYKGRHNLNQIKAQFLEEIALLQDVHGLSTMVIDVIKRALPVPAVEFYHISDDRSELRNLQGAVISLTPQTTRWLLAAPHVTDFNLVAAASDGGPQSILIPSELMEPSFSYLIPLIQKTQILGVLYLAEKVDYRRLTVDEVQFLTTLGRAVAVALSNARMYQHIANLKEVQEKQTVILREEIEERKSAEAALRASEKKYRLVADNVLDVIWILDIGQDRLSYISPAVEKVFGYSTEEALGLSLDQIMVPRSRMMVKSEIDAQLAREAAGIDGTDWSITMELEHLRKHQTKVWTEVIMGFRRDKKGKPVALMGVTRDITERRRAEAMRLAKVEAEEANQAKSEFLANMSHELRTPLNHIIGFTELVVSKNFGPLTKKQEEYLQDVLNSSGHLLALINEVLDLSKVEAGKMTLIPSEVNLGELTRNSLKMVQEKAKKHQIQLDLSLNNIPRTITADERKIKQIIYNLLSNAVKFTPSGGCVTVSADAVIDFSGKNVGEVEIRVSDTGIGLACDDLERVFEVFVQVEQAADRNYQGTGLGLPLTRRMVELHGGRLWAESDGLGQGCTFICRLPIQPPLDSEVESR